MANQPPGNWGVRQFLAWLWLLPVFMPFAQDIGRAAFNILLGVYFFWGAFVFITRRPALPRWLLVSWLGLVAAFAVSLLASVDAQRSFETWFKWMGMLSVMPFTWMVLQTDQSKWPQLLRMLSGVALAFLLYQMLTLAYYAIVHGNAFFTPEVQINRYTALKEDNLPWLLPWMLLLVSASRWRRPSMGLLVALVVVYIVAADGSAALAGMLVALFVFVSILHLQMKVRYVLGFALVMSVAVLAIAWWVPPVTELAHQAANHRLEIWQRAIAAEGLNVFSGTGMGNAASLSDQIYAVNPGDVHHAHNFIVDVWLETGITGLSALLLFLATPAWVVWQHRACIRAEDRPVVVAAFASAAAILVAGLFSFSYASRQFAHYLPLLFVVMTYAGYRSRNSAA